MRPVPPPHTGPPFVRITQLQGVSPVRGTLASGGVGDWLLENERLQVVVSGLDNHDGFAATGGNVIDAAPKGGEDLLREVLTYFDDTFPRQAFYESLGPEGGDPDAAVLVAKGRDVDASFIRVQTRYILRRGSNHLEIQTTLENTGADTLRRFDLGDAIEWGYAEAFAPGPGWSLAGTQGDIPFLTGAAYGTAYAWVNPLGNLRGPHARLWSDPIVMVVDIPPEGKATYTRFLVVENGSAAEAIAAAWAMRGTSTGSLTVTVKGHEGGKIEGARVLLEDEFHTPSAWGETDAAGEVTFWVPAGKYAPVVEHPERGTERAEAEEVRAEHGASEQISLPEPGTLFLSAVDGGDRPSPARWTFEGLDQTPNPRFGPDYASPGAGPLLLTPTGRGKFRVPPGKYRVTASRGILFDSWIALIEVASGKELSLHATLPRLDVPPEWISADLHVHAVPSFDSTVRLADRGRSLACEGIDWFAASDHYRRTDYTPVLDTLSLAAPLHVLPSEEVTTAKLGHFGAFPLPIHPDRPGSGGLRPLGWGIDKIFSTLQGEGDDVLLMVNHPRSKSNGYFELAGFDTPGTTPASDLRLDFSFLEILNGKSNPKFDQIWDDWMELLLEGYRVVGVGNSDSHRIFGQEVGYPRNLVRLPAGANPADPAALLAALKGGSVVGSNGPFIQFTLEGATVGETVERPPGTLRGWVRVIAPSWVDVRRVGVWVNGVEIATYMVRGKGTPVRFDEAIEVPVRESSFAIVRVEGDDSLAPVLPPLQFGDRSVPVQPVAFTNPIWIEVSGRR